MSTPKAPSFVFYAVYPADRSFMHIIATNVNDDLHLLLDKWNIQAGVIEEIKNVREFKELNSTSPSRIVNVVNE